MTKRNPLGSSRSNGEKKEETEIECMNGTVERSKEIKLDRSK